MAVKCTNPSLLPPLPEDFLDDLEIFFCKRMDRLNPAKESVEYAALEKTAQRLTGQVETALPESAVSLLGELCECYTAMAALATGMYYRYGFADGIKMIVLGCAPWP